MTATTTYTTGEALHAAGMSRKALRLYEQRGLLPPPARDAAGYRRYTTDDLATLVFIRSARALGLHLNDIARILAVHHRGQNPCRDVRGVLDQRITEIDATITGLRELRTHLVAARHRPTAATTARTICPVIQNDDSSWP